MQIFVFAVSEKKKIRASEIQAPGRVTPLGPLTSLPTLHSHIQPTLLPPAATAPYPTPILVLTTGTSFLIALGSLVVTILPSWVNNCPEGVSQFVQF